MLVRGVKSFSGGLYAVQCSGGLYGCSVGLYAVQGGYMDAQVGYTMKKIMMEIVATDVVASLPPERQLN